MKEKNKKRKIKMQIKITGVMTNKEYLMDSLIEKIKKHKYYNETINVTKEAI